MGRTELVSREAIDAINDAHWRKNACLVRLDNVAVGNDLIEDKMCLVNVEHNVEFTLQGTREAMRVRTPHVQSVLAMFSDIYKAQARDVLTNIWLIH